MNFLSFEYFVAIYESGTVRKAAENLYISQQALSEHLNKLEREIGMELLNRTNPMTLTRAGEHFLDTAQLCLSARHDMEKKIEDEKKYLQHTLNIGVPSGYSPMLLPEFLSFFRSDHPELALSIVELSCQTGALREIPPHVDAVMGAFPSGNRLKHIPLIEDRNFVVAVHRDLLDWILGNQAQEVRKLALAGEAQELARFRDCPFVLKREGTIVRDNENRLFSRAGFRPKGHMETGDMDLTIQLCQRAEAAVFLPEPIARAYFFYAQGQTEEKSPILCCRVSAEDEYWALTVAHPVKTTISLALNQFVTSARTFYEPLMKRL
ncbi:MAG: transcriptional regulator, LysR family [Oscillospiraceae bacterium]|nr:transcriptional regulator, LysR family [Oscillospiraceae bacterium]